jgi:aminobutyraldehyde dehydrogenase
MFGNFINNEWVEGDVNSSIEVINPSTGVLITKVPPATKAIVNMAVDSAKIAFPLWAAKSPSARASAMLDLADIVIEHAQELAKLESLNVGKPFAGALDEIMYTADCIRFIAGASRTLEGQAAGEYATGHTSFLRRDPVGVCGQIAPWNYPLHIALVKSVQAIAVGNTVVVKPSELTPLSLLRFMELASEALPPGVLNVVTGEGIPIGEAIVAHPEIRAISFTGDVATGTAITINSASKLKRLTLELGGKSPVIVFADADLSAVADMLKFGAFANSGQDCQAASRVLVENSAYEDLMTELVKRVDTIKVGDPQLNDAIDMGPVVSQTQQNRVAGFVDRAISEGGEVTTGGGKINSAGYFFEPTVVGNVRQDFEIIQKEVFGPVVTLQKFANEEEGLKFANGTEYGLSSSIWTRDIGKAMRVSRELQCGSVWINAHFIGSPEMPHGGFKQSGYGKDYSKYALEDNTVVKHVSINNSSS